MSTAEFDNVTELDVQNLRALVELQRAHFRAEGEVTHATRVDRLKRLKALIEQDIIRIDNKARVRQREILRVQLVLRVRVESGSHRLLDQASQRLDEAGIPQDQHSNESIRREEP